METIIIIQYQPWQTLQMYVFLLDHLYSKLSIPYEDQAHQISDHIQNM